VAEVADERVDRILDATYACFTRHGIRRTTMDDIAAEAGMSRPAVYQYVRNKDDAFRRLAERLFALAADHAAESARSERSLVDRLHRTLATKLELTLQLHRDSPHAAELLDAGTRLSTDLIRTFTDELRDLLAGALTDAAGRGEIDLAGHDAAEVAAIALALTTGLEGDLSDPEVPRHRLRSGVELLVAGLAARRPH
jgi:TetR/AcrR family transcriptional regulator